MTAKSLPEKAYAQESWEQGDYRAYYEANQDRRWPLCTGLPCIYAKHLPTENDHSAGESCDDTTREQQRPTGLSTTPSSARHSHENRG